MLGTAETAATARRSSSALVGCSRFRRLAEPDMKHVVRSIIDTLSKVLTVWALWCGVDCVVLICGGVGLRRLVLSTGFARVIM